MMCSVARGSQFKINVLRPAGTRSSATACKAGQLSNTALKTQRAAACPSGWLLHSCKHGKIPMLEGPAGALSPAHAQHCALHGLDVEVLLGAGHVVGAHDADLLAGGHLAGEDTPKGEEAPLV